MVVGLPVTLRPSLAPLVTEVTWMNWWAARAVQGSIVVGRAAEVGLVVALVAAGAVVERPAVA